MKCPTCGEEAVKVIYLGFPMKLCSNDNCNTVWGFWSCVPGIWFNGWFTTYEGWYLPALWHWLFGNPE